MTRGRWLRLIAISVFAAGGLIAGRIGPFASYAASPGQGSAILSRLHKAADDGNLEAQQALADFERFASARGQTAATAADLAQQIRELVNAPGLAVGAQGLAPFWIRLDASRDFANKADLETYRAARQLVLSDLALRDPNRVISAQVSFSARPTPADLLRLLSSYSGSITEMHVDVLRDGGRLLTYGSRDDAARAMNGRSAEDVVHEIRSNLIGAGLEECGADPATVELRVKFLRLELRAAQAVRLATAAGILAVDPLTDVQDQYSGRAAHVTVGAWPNLTETWEAFDGRAIAEKPCGLAK